MQTLYLNGILSVHFLNVLSKHGFEVFRLNFGLFLDRDEVIIIIRNLLILSIQR